MHGLHPPPCKNVCARNQTVCYESLQVTVQSNLVFCVPTVALTVERIVDWRERERETV